ncbi:MAG: hypothetical protein ACKO96_21730 [Flammeovirgaceae bacterium]
MFLREQNQTINELPLPNLCGFIILFAVFEEILVDPHLPLQIHADCDHALGRVESTEFVNQDIIADHHLFQQV